MMFVINWIVQYFWNEAINTLKVTLLITLFMIVFTFFNHAGCMFSSLDIEDRAKEGINYGLTIVDFILLTVSLTHGFTALLRATKYKG